MARLKLQEFRWKFLCSLRLSFDNGYSHQTAKFVAIPLKFLAGFSFGPLSFWTNAADEFELEIWCVFYVSPNARWSHLIFLFFFKHICKLLPQSIVAMSHTNFVLSTNLPCILLENIFEKKRKEKKINEELIKILSLCAIAKCSGCWQECHNAMMSKLAHEKINAVQCEFILKDLSILSINKYLSFENCARGAMATLLTNHNIFNTHTNSIEPKFISREREK